MTINVLQMKRQGKKEPDVGHSVQASQWDT